MENDDLNSVGSCSSELRDEDDNKLENLVFDKVYLSTHAGLCLQTVLQDLMETRDINVMQKSELEAQFNRIYHDAYAQCQSRLHLNVHAKLNEYSSIETGSVFQIQDCVINGPSSSVRVPQGEAKLVHANNVFRSE